MTLPPNQPAVLLLDKAGAMTSHDVVAKTRRWAGTRKVGHAGTLDPMATGLLILGLNSATRLLHYIVGLDKVYSATIRLGASSSTDDAEGVVSAPAPAALLDAIDQDGLEEALSPLRGVIQQVPSAVSAIKVDGKRAYDRVRAGEEVTLASREVTVHAFEVHSMTRMPEALELEVRVHCSSGTYIRALARDLGAALGVGGHLTRLRRDAIGPFTLEQAGSLEAPEAGLLTPAAVARKLFPVVVLDAEQERDLGHGKPLGGLESGALDLGTEPIAELAALSSDERLLGLLSWNGTHTRVLSNFPQPEAKEQA